MSIMNFYLISLNPVSVIAEQARPCKAKRGRGRPPGSKNKPKPDGGQGSRGGQGSQGRRGCRGGRGSRGGKGLGRGRGSEVEGLIDEEIEIDEAVRR